MKITKPYVIDYYVIITDTNTGHTTLKGRYPTVTSAKRVAFNFKRDFNAIEIVKTIAVVSSR